MAGKKPTRPPASDALELFHPVTAAWFRAVFEQPTAPPGVHGVPSQFVRHTLGEVVLDNEAYLAPPAQNFVPLTTQPVTGSVAPLTSSTTTTGGSSSSTGASAPSTATITHQPTIPLAATLTLAHPRWLLLAYLAWQALMIALVGSLYLQRAARRRTA